MRRAAPCTAWRRNDDRSIISPDPAALPHLRLRHDPREGASMSDPSPSASDLPVAAVLSDLIDAMASRHAVLVAEPGAGKTTLVPPALLSAPWLTGQVVMLEPRRVVARAAARRLAEGFGEAVGETVGIRTRSETRIGPRTGIEVVTEGVFSRAARSNPELSGVGCVVFDEYHERSLDADWGLALALDIARSLRPDLRLLAMSATIDPAPLAALMDGAAVLRSKGRVHPVALRHRSVPPRERIEDAVAETARFALSEGEGSVLAFLPGRGEVDRTVRLLAPRVPDEVDVLPLHGGLNAKAQDRAVSAPPLGRRHVVVATPIAESSLTIAGVRTVVDSGLVREPVHDFGVGVTRLETRRASRASVDQRAGRAGRTAPGTAWRLWTEAATSGLAPAAPPAITRSDLSALVLDALDWGVGPDRVHEMSWLDPPPGPALNAATGLLVTLGLIEGEGDAIALTPHGRAASLMPVGPREARALLSARREDVPQVSTYLVLLSEQGLGGNVLDLDTRLRQFERERSPRAKEARRLAERWSRAASEASAAHAIGGSADRNGAITLGWPDRVARARGPARPDGRRAYLMASGRGAWVDGTDPLALSEWIVALDLTGTAREQRVTAGLPTSRAEVEDVLGHTALERVDVALDPRTGRIDPVHRRSLGAIVLDERPVGADEVADDVVSQALADAIRSAGLDALGWDRRSRAVRARLAWLHARDPDRWANVSDRTLLADLETWLLPFRPGARRLDRFDDVVLAEALLARMPWDRRDEFDRVAPPAFVAPTGTKVAIDYPADGGSPRMAVRVQELFGLQTHPIVGGEPLILDLLSPARRPIQTTSDLPGFWKGSWAEVRRDMRARYPRHPWPDDPASAKATTRAKPRG